MLSDNIDAGFFMGEIKAQYEHIRGDGIVEVRQKGTVQLLDEWLTLKFRVGDRSPIDAMIHTMKRVRKLRSKPAHSINEDRFDQKYFVHQREMIIETYQAVQTLRLILAKHPKAKTYQLPSTLTEMEIWTE
jgi:hypothetical protein